DLGVRRRRQPLRRRPRAVGAEEGPGEAAAPERRALYARGVAALPRRRAGAVRARRGGEDPLGARPDGRADARRRGLGPAPGRRGRAGARRRHAGPRPAPRLEGEMMAMVTDEYVRTILEVAERDASIARVLREICALEGGVRASALDFVGAHLRATSAAADVL